MVVPQLLLPKGIQELVRTNEPLTELHAASVKDCIEEQTRLLERGEKEVEDLIELLHAKRQQVAKMKLGIQACKRVLELTNETTILMVPTEVLQVIFHHSLPTTLSACFKHPSNYSANPPFSLVQVCRRWRTVALDMPSLWTFFSIRNHIRRPEEVLNACAESLFNFVKSHFQRSGNLPKSVDIYLPFHSLYKKGVALDDGTFLGAVLTHDVKIKNLSFGADDICDQLSPLDSDSSNRPNSPNSLNPSILESVESLVLYSTSNRGSRLERPDSTLAKLHPNHFKSLRRLSLDHGDRHITAVSFPIPWSNLTHLVINSWISWRPWLTLFAKLTTLQEGIFYIHYNEWSNDDSALESYKTRLPHLTDLTLIFQSYDYNQIALPTYSFPSLKHIRLAAYERRFRQDRNDILTLRPDKMVTYFFNLTALSLYHSTWQITLTEIVDILTYTPNIRSLTLSVDVDYNSLLPRFHSSKNLKLTPLLVPLLEEFTIESASIEYDKSETYYQREPDPYAAIFHKPVPKCYFNLSNSFINMVRARSVRWARLGVSQLKKASLFLEKRYQTELVLAEIGLESAVERGLELNTRVVNNHQSWNDPFNKVLTHWHDGLVFPDDLEPRSDCATCVRLAWQADEEKERKRIEKERQEEERKAAAKAEEEEEDEEYYSGSGDEFGSGGSGYRTGDYSDGEDWY